MTMGERLSKLRMEKGMSRQELANAVGMTYEGIMRIEQGVVGKTLEKVPRLARALGTTTDALFPEIDPDPEPKKTAGGFEEKDEDDWGDMNTKEGETMTFGQRVKEIRISRGYSQQQMAEAIGITTQAYSLIERGESGKAYEKLPIMAKKFGVDIDALFPEMDPEMDPEPDPEPEKTAGAGGFEERLGDDWGDTSFKGGEHMTIGERLRELRMEKGISLKGMSEAVGMTAPGYLRLENGSVGKGFEKLPAIAMTLGVSIDRLFPQMDEKPKEEKEMETEAKKQVRARPDVISAAELDKLKRMASETPCPFCGAQILLYTPESYVFNRGYGRQSYQLTCGYCGARGSICVSEEQALHNWIDIAGIMSDGRGEEGQD